MQRARLNVLFILKIIKASNDYDSRVEKVPES